MAFTVVKSVIELISVLRKRLLIAPIRAEYLLTRYSTKIPPTRKEIQRKIILLCCLFLRFRVPRRQPKNHD